MSMVAIEDALEIKRAKNRIAVKKYSEKKRRLAGVPLLTKPESIETIEELSIPVPECGCWIWTNGTNRAGYGVIVTGGVRWLAHRLSWKVYNGEIPDGMIVCHRCDNPSCVNPNHLFLGTTKDNMDDMNKKGRHAKGESVKSAKLTESQIDSIRAMTCSNIRIAKHFGVSRSCIDLIKNGKTWRHV